MKLYNKSIYVFNIHYKKNIILGTYIVEQDYNFNEINYHWNLDLPKDLEKEKEDIENLLEEIDFDLTDDDIYL